MQLAPPTIVYTQEYKKGSPGNDLLSQGPASQVPSALEGLTTWFGMEQGVSPPLEPPEEPSMPFLPTGNPVGRFDTLETEQDVPRGRKLTFSELSPRPLVRLS